MADLKTISNDLRNKVQPKWFIIVLAVINIGFISDYFGLIKFNKELSLTESEKVIKGITEDRNYYQKLYRECSDNLKSIHREISLLKADRQLSGALKNDYPFPVWMKNLSGVMIWVNKAYEKQFLEPRGLSASDYIGFDDFAIWDNETAESYILNDKEALRKGLVDTIEEVPRIDGKVEKWRVIKFKRSIGGLDVGIMGICFIDK